MGDNRGYEHESESFQSQRLVFLSFTLFPFPFLDALEKKTCKSLAKMQMTMEGLELARSHIAKSSLGKVLARVHGHITPIPDGGKKEQS